MLKMNIRQLLGVVAFLTFFSGGAMTQNLSVSYKNKPLEEVLADLKQKTNYNFVYQKQILAGTRSVTANFNDMPLTYILDRVLYNNGLDYEIVKENVIIRPADKENFKKVVSGRVVDIQNIPMPGVNVRVKDTGTGVATGINGEFSIPALQESVSVQKDGTITVTLANLSAEQSYPVEIALTEKKNRTVSAKILTGAMNAHNTFEEPDAVKEESFEGVAEKDGTLSLEIPACSVICLRIS